jgi:hypothetical protein
LPTPLSTTHGGYDLIFYEEYIIGNNEIQMDRVILQISNDGVTWYTILNWGDGAADSNTSIAVPLTFTMPYTNCSGEPDNCPISSASPNLVGNSGIQINITGVVPAGTYSYVRIADPGTGDGIGFDGFTVIP